jgi:hypothetical protein
LERLTLDSGERAELQARLLAVARFGQNPIKKSLCPAKRWNGFCGDLRMLV